MWLWRRRMPLLWLLLSRPWSIRCASAQAFLLCAAGLWCLVLFSYNNVFDAKILFIFQSSNFFWKFSAKSLHVSNLFHTFAIATILMWDIPHEQRARIYVQARPKYLLRLWAYFFCPYLSALSRGSRPLFMWDIPHNVRCKITKYGGSPSTCFLALCGGEAWEL